jgi:hypothetical protein
MCFYIAIEKRLRAVMFSRHASAHDARTGHQRKLRIAVLLVAALASSAACKAQVVGLRVPIIWDAMRDIMNLAAFSVNYEEQKKQINTNLRNTRARYWQEYPNGPGFEDARSAFGKALWQKTTSIRIMRCAICYWEVAFFPFRMN